jgi:beta-lactamase superfamily II metal-dependent hydrolase
MIQAELLHIRRLAIVAIAMALLVLSVIPAAGAGDLAPGGTFSDDDGNIHEGNIEAIAAVGITRGCNPPANDLYCPGAAVNRGQMAAFLVRALDLPAASQDYFTDDDESIFEDDINRLAEAGITKGCNPPTNDLYCPDSKVTREQMAAFLVRALDLTDDGGGNLFTDDDSSIFEKDIDKLGTAGITRGCNPPTNNRFCPKDLVLRDQMASFLARALGLDPITPPPPVAGGNFISMFVAVRQGDGGVFVGACGETAVIDANRFRSSEMLEAIDSIGSRSIEWIATTHYDADHLGAIVDVATASGVTVGQFYDRGGDRTVKDSATYRGYYDYVTGLGKRTSLNIGDVITLCSGADRVIFTVVSAGTDGTAAGGVAVSEENDRGLCFHIEYGDFDMVVCSDINGVDDGSRTDVETPVANTVGEVEFLKVNHHGSSFSSNSHYVNTTSPRAVVISTGANGFGHPSAVVIARWDTVGDVYRTQDASNSLIDGDVTISTTGADTFALTTSGSGVAKIYGLDE